MRGAEVMAVLRVPVLAVAHRDELRQVVVERAESVVHPGAERRELAVEHVPAGVELRLGAVIVVGRVHRADDGDVVDAASHVRHPVAHLDAALAVLPEADLQRIELLPLLVVDTATRADSASRGSARP